MPTSIFNFKIFSRGYTPRHQLKGDRSGGEKISVEGRGEKEKGQKGGEGLHHGCWRMDTPASTGMEKFTNTVR